MTSIDPKLMVSHSAAATRYSGPFSTSPASASCRRRSAAERSSGSSGKGLNRMIGTRRGAFGFADCGVRNPIEAASLDEYRLPSKSGLARSLLGRVLGARDDAAAALRLIHPDFATGTYLPLAT